MCLGGLVPEPGWSSWSAADCEPLGITWQEDFHIHVCRLFPVSSTLFRLLVTLPEVVVPRINFIQPSSHVRGNRCAAVGWWEPGSRHSYHLFLWLSL